MNARLPTPTTTPDQLVAQWTPLMRSLAYRTGTDLDDIQQEAWLLAATMPRGRGDFVARWLAAVRCHAAAQRPGVTVRPSERSSAGEEYIGSAWLAGSADGDPSQILQAAQVVAQSVGGSGDDEVRWKRIRQEIELPRTSCELAAARGVSERQGRRYAARLRAIDAQAGLFDGLGEEGGKE